MKTIITAVTLALASPAIDDKPAVSDDTCTKIGLFAQIMMTHRQNGGSISALMPEVEGKTLLVKMLMAAYEEPRYNTPEYQERAVSDFRSDWELACYQTQMGE